MKIAAVRVWATTILLYALFCFLPDKRLAVLVSVGYVGVIAWLLKDIGQALLVSYMALLPVSVGKFFPIDLVHANVLHLLDRPFGIAANITVTVREGLIVYMAIALGYKSIRERRLVMANDFLGWALLFLPICLSISALFGSIRPGISLWQTLFFLEPYIMYLFVTRLRKQWEHRLIFSAGIAALVGETIIVIAQNVVGKTLGLAVENFPGYVPIDVSTDAGYLSRLGGTFAHANMLAHYVVFALCIALPVFFDQQSPVRKQAAIAVFLGLVSLLLALSRSAWISFAVAIILFFYLTRTVGWKRLFVPSYTRWIYVGAAAVLLVLVIRIGLPRAASTTRTMEPYGSGITRILLLREAGVVIGLHPIFGVGLAMDTYVFYLRSRSLHIPLVSYFPDPVQNGFVQLLMQVGVVGLLPYFIIMIALGKMIWRRVARGSGKKRLYLAGVAASFLGVVVNAQLQPLLPDVSALVLLIAVLT